VIPGLIWEKGIIIKYSRNYRKINLENKKSRKNRKQPYWKCGQD
jgi:hypothetical protein